MTTPVWIGLGSNLGDREGILGAAVAALAEAPGVDVVAVSSYHETAPVGGPPGQGPFLNAAARLNTTFDPHQLLAVLQDIENQLGRVRVVRWGERTLDLDILIFGCKFLDTKELKLPHPRLAFRRFVLAPLAEIAPHIVDTISRQTIAGLLANLDRRPRLIALEGPQGPLKSEVFRRLVEELPAAGIEGEEPGEEERREQADPQSRAHSPSFWRNAEALLVDRWSGETLREPWLVADYCLNFDQSKNGLNYITALNFRNEAPGPSVSPLFAVLLPPDGGKMRPGLTYVPKLRPESDDPDAIVAEIIATCRGIEGI